MAIKAITLLAASLARKVIFIISSKYHSVTRKKDQHINSVTFCFSVVLYTLAHKMLPSLAANVLAQLAEAFI